MSVKKFKVGDKVKVREGLVANKYYDGVRCDSSMAKMGGRVLTINRVKRSYYVVEKYSFVWSDEMLEPAEKTLDNLVAGDFVKNLYSTKKRKILIAINGCYLMSKEADYRICASVWFTAHELDELGYRPVEPDTPEPTIEIGGKKYKKADVEKAIKDLEVVE